MAFQFELLDLEHIHRIIPLIQKLTENKFTDEVLKVRFAEMATQNYECAVIYDQDQLIGVTGIWYSTRHYVGKSAEIDHVFIEENYRGQGLGKAFLKWIYEHVKLKGCKAVELNTYVQNYPSHKFYYNEGFEILGYHFLKKL